MRSPGKSSQLKLVRYAQKTPRKTGLPHALQNGARGCRGESMQSRPSSGDKSPPNSSNAGTGGKGRSEGPTRVENVGESHRFEAAADVVAQRVKALERATVDGHWSSAQFLELIPPDSSTLLERGEEVYLAKKYLLEQKSCAVTIMELGNKKAQERAKEKRRSPETSEKGKGERNPRKRTRRKVGRSEGTGTHE